MESGKVDKYGGGTLNKIVVHVAPARVFYMIYLVVTGVRSVGFAELIM